MDENPNVPNEFELRGELPPSDPRFPTGVKLYLHLPTGIEFVLVSGGEGVVGSDRGGIDQRPKHSVRIEPFLLGRYSVTIAQWREIMGDTPTDASFSPERSLASDLGDAYPVADVSWQQCMEFCRRTSKQNGNTHVEQVDAMMLCRR